MASMYRRSNSPFWWIKWRNPSTNRIERFSTECLIGDGDCHRKALRIRNEHSIKETGFNSAARKNPFREWVPSYLQATHSNSPKTLIRYEGNWRILSEYFASRDITAPSQVTREICLDYVAWRKKTPHRHRKKSPCINTVIMELKFVNKLLNEALIRQYVPFNPAARLGLKRDPTRPKNELSDSDIAIIRREIQQRIKSAKNPKQVERADFLEISFEIARLQGIRLNETHIPLDDIDLKNQTITVTGKGRKREEINMNPQLLPLFAKLKSDAGRTHTYPKPSMPSLTWFKFFKSLRLRYPSFQNVSYHSTRVTVISRMERAGAPEVVIMKAVLHSSTTVHRVYRKVKRSELEPFWPAVSSGN